jgi:hypothetical protein
VHGDPVVQKRDLAFRWEMVGDDFWGLSGATMSELKQVRQAYEQKMKANRTLIVIDPVAFYTPNGMFLFERIASCVGDEKSAVIVLPPFYTDRSRLRVHEELQAAVQSFASYYQPAIPAIEQADCSLAVTDESDIVRVLRLAVGRHVRTLDPALTPHPYLSTGAGNR